MPLHYLFIGLFTLLNLGAFLVMAWDKRLARQGREAERIPEGVLFFLATVFGALGVYTGMIVLRHKSRKWYFILGIPLLIIHNGATLFVMSTFFFTS